MSKLVKLLSQHTGLAESDVNRIIGRAPDTYKSYVIQKRNGKGDRLISQPAREVKALQRVLMARLQSLQIHDAAMAYRKGTSIRSNALRHSQSGPIMKYDFKSFFPSIRGTDWEKYCENNSIFSDPDDIRKSINLLFHREKDSSIFRLAIGAPSSPWLSNVLMYEFDDAISRAVAPDRVIYTRYADDLTFSAPRTGHLTVVDRAVRKIVQDLKSPKLTINEDKTVLATPKYRRVVTGLVISNSGEVSIGRDKKRLIRAKIYRALKGEISWEDANALLGFVAHIRAVEPSFYYKLLTHYGNDFEKVILRKSPLVTMLPF